MNADELTEERGKDYGHPWDDFRCVQEMWKALVRHRSADDNASETYHQCVNHVLYLLLVKVARLAHSPTKRDTLEDIAGYAKTLEMCLDVEEGHKMDSVASEVAKEFENLPKTIKFGQTPHGFDKLPDADCEEDCC